MPHRRTIKANVTPEAHAALQAIAARYDMVQQGVASRLIEWFGAQDQRTQLAVLGMWGDDAPEFARLVLEKLASAASPAPQDDDETNGHNGGPRPPPPGKARPAREQKESGDAGEKSRQKRTG